MTFNEVYKLTHKLHVLYAEDAVAMREAVLKFIKPLFASVTTAVDGKDAFEKYIHYRETHEKDFDIVITDVLMPNIDGVTLCQKIKDCHDQQPIIVTSGQDDFKMLIDLINIGVTKFVAKPVQEEKIVDLIGRVGQEIYKRYLERLEQEEVKEHNEILKQRDALHTKLYNDFFDLLNSNSIIAKADLEGNITYVNELFCKTTQYTQEELIGKNFRMLKNPETPSSFFTKLWNTLENQKAYKNIFQNRRKDGSIYYVEQVIKPVVDDKGRTTEYLAIANDVTRLFNAVRQEKEAKQLTNDFFRNFGHEVKTPLNAILGVSPFLLKKLHDQPKLLELYEVVDENSKKLHRLLENVLDIQKINANEMSSESCDFHPVNMMHTLFEKWKNEAYLKEQHFSVDTMDEAFLPLLHGDEKHIVAIVDILLDNAMKFTPAKGTIECSVEYVNGDLIITVKDSGIGIKQEDQNRIFYMSQADGSITREHGGTGMGLYIASKLTAMLKGEIRLRSIPKKGSIFSVIIPCKEVKKS